MGIGVIPGQVAVPQPQEALYTQVLAQARFHCRQIHTPIAVGVEQTGGGAQQGALAIGLDGAAFQHEIHVAQGRAVAVLAVDFAVDSIVQARAVLVAPGIELEVEQFDPGRVADTDRAVVPRPGIVGGDR